MGDIIKVLTTALQKLEETAEESQNLLAKEQQRRINTSEQLAIAQQELQQMITDEDALIKQYVELELEKPLQSGAKLNAKLTTQIQEIKQMHGERTYVVEELQHTISNMRCEYFDLEKQLEKSQAAVQETGNLLNASQKEYLELQKEQNTKTINLRQLQEEVAEMESMLKKLKEIQVTLNKVIKPDLNKTISTSQDDVFKNSFLEISGQQVQVEEKDEFWYKATISPNRLPKIK